MGHRVSINKKKKIKLSEERKKKKGEGVCTRKGMCNGGPVVTQRQSGMT
jgi:hypothetical protein